MDHLKLIDDEIASHRAEITKLEQAKEVLMRLATTHDKPKSKTVAASKQKPAKPAKAVKAAVAKAASAKPEKSMAPAIKERIEEILKTAPMTSGQIIENLGLSDRKQNVYTALSAMKSAGHLEKNDKGEYAMPAAG